jgi:hypothetical protein
MAFRPSYTHHRGYASLFLAKPLADKNIVERRSPG